MSDPHEHHWFLREDLLWGCHGCTVTDTEDPMSRWFRESGNVDFWNKLACVQRELDRIYPEHGAADARVARLEEALEDAAHALERIATADRESPRDGAWVDTDTTVWELARFAAADAREALTKPPSGGEGTP